MSNPLTDVLPAKARKIAYAALFVAALVFAAYQASGGDWKMFVGGLIVALTGATAASNTPASSPPADEAGSADVVIIFYLLGIVFFVVATLNLLGVGTRGLFG
jgi:hypothetical protein